MHFFLLLKIIRFFFFIFSSYFYGKVQNAAFFSKVRLCFFKIFHRISQKTFTLSLLKILQFAYVNFTTSSRQTLYNYFLNLCREFYVGKQKCNFFAHFFFRKFLCEFFGTRILCHFSRKFFQKILNKKNKSHHKIMRCKKFA